MLTQRSTSFASSASQGQLPQELLPTPVSPLRFVPRQKVLEDSRLQFHHQLEKTERKETPLSDVITSAPQ